MDNDNTTTNMIQYTDATIPLTRYILQIDFNIRLQYVTRSIEIRNKSENYI